MAPYKNAALRLKALAHPVRLQILDMLRADDEVCVCHMEAAFGKRQAYISQQLMVLRDAGLVESRRDGLKVFYRLADGTVRDLLEAALGPVKDSGPATFDGCPCPHCAAAAEKVS